MVAEKMIGGECACVSVVEVNFGFVEDVDHDSKRLKNDVDVDAAAAVGNVAWLTRLVVHADVRCPGHHVAQSTLLHSIYNTALLLSRHMALAG